MKADFLKSLQAPCACGLDHSLATKEILVENGALYRLKDLLVGRGMTGSGTVICDTNTRMAAGDLVCQVLNDSSRVVLPAEGLHADEKAIETVLAQAPAADYYIAVGSGTIHDITRYVAHKRGVDFVSVPTAASVDGFTSTVAAMTLDGMKVTLPARAPVLVVADLDIIADAPYRLTCAGFGDILGKYTALADWEIAHLVTGEHICRKVVDLQAQNIREVVALRGGLRDGNPRAFKKLTQALLMSGLAMQMMRHSRPASGVEHHISHLWEMHVLGNTVDALHGEKVGVATGIACGAYKRFVDIQDITPYLKPYPGVSEETLRPAFGDLTPFALKENTPDCLAGVDPAQIAAHFDDIRAILRLLPTREEIVAMLHELGAPAVPADVGIDDQTLARTLRYCPYARNRLTLYRMTLMMDAERLGLY